MNGGWRSKNSRKTYCFFNGVELFFLLFLDAARVLLAHTTMERQAATTTITESRSMVIARRMWKRESGKKGIKCTLWLLKSAVLWKFNVFSPFLFPWSCVMNNATIYIHTLCLGRKEEGEASKLFLCSHFLISLFRRWSGRGKLSKYQAVQQQQRPTNLFHSFFFLFCCSLPLRVCFVCSTTGCCCWFSLGMKNKKEGKRYENAK